MTNPTTPTALLALAADMDAYSFSINDGLLGTYAERLRTIATELDTVETRYLLVLSDNYDVYEPKGIFATPELAQSAAVDHPVHDPDNYHVLPFTVNVMTERR